MSTLAETLGITKQEQASKLGDAIEVKIKLQRDVVAALRKNATLLGRTVSDLVNEAACAALELPNRGVSMCRECRRGSCKPGRAAQTAGRKQGSGVLTPREASARRGRLGDPRKGYVAPPDLPRVTKPRIKGVEPE